MLYDGTNFANFADLKNEIINRHFSVYEKNNSIICIIHFFIILR